MNNHGGSADRPQVHRVIFYAMQQHKSGSFARPFALSRTGSQYAVQSLVGKSRGREKKKTTTKLLFHHLTHLRKRPTHLREMSQDPSVPCMVGCKQKLSKTPCANVLVCFAGLSGY